MPTNGETLPRRGEVGWGRLHLEGSPGTVRLAGRATGLPKASVANVYDVQKVFRTDFLERVGQLSPQDLEAVNGGLSLVLGI